MIAIWKIVIIATVPVCSRLAESAVTLLLPELNVTYASELPGNECNSSLEVVLHVFSKVKLTPKVYSIDDLVKIWSMDCVYDKNL